MSDKKLDNNVIRFDWAMKRLLREKTNFSVLNGFLSVVLDQPVEIVELLESESNQLAADDKFNRVDLKARDSKGEIVLIEVQNTREADYFHRVLYSTSKAITEHLRLGQDYSEVKKVYSISIVYFNLGQGEDYLYKGTTEFRGLHNYDDILQLSDNQQKLYKADTPADIFPEYYILRVDSFNSVASTPLEEWISFLKDNTIPDSFTAPGLTEAREQLQLAQLTDEERGAYLRRVDYEVSERSTYQTGKAEGLAEGRAEGLAEGRAEGLAEGEMIGEARGRKDEKQDIARRMLGKGMAAEDIAEMTGLTVEEIEQMQ